MRSTESGFQMAEMLVSLAVLTILLMIALPALSGLAGGVRLELAADEMAGALRGARSLAIQLNSEVAVKLILRADGSATWAVYRDGNGNGVLNRDITAGVDPMVTPPRALEELGKQIRFGFPPGKRVRDPGDPGQLLATDDPIRFNSSNLASFGPLGTGTAGSLYLTDGQSRLMAVRVFGRTGKVKVIAYDFDAEIWR
jgi:type II secretory pathway pseudopilin PulG